MKLLDTEETIVVVTGGSTEAERDRTLALWLQSEIDRRGDGQAYRRAVVTDDQWYLDSGMLQQHPTTLVNDGERMYVQADFDADVKRVGLWGADAAATSAAVDAFVVHGYLDDLLRRIWRFRSGMLA